MNWQKLIFDLFTYGILVYSCVLLFFYIFIGVVSSFEIRKYLRKNSVADLRVLAASEHLPGISIIAPAYNESPNIIENVRSMLSIHYNLLELIIVNDGSKDDTLKKLMLAYDLFKTNTFIHEQIPTKKVRDVYKSNNPVYRKLIVVDKENGGKADALNVGINLAQYGHFICVDVDCVLEQDALLKMIKPFLEETKVRVIASGGVVRIANNCIIENGRLLKINLPKKFIARVQTIEYIRAFLLGRIAWSRLNGLLLISGAFGAFDKEIVIKCGGYNVKTVGEDMELIVRMRRYMEENKIPYKVTYIPDPLCWTEAPDNFKILGRQRNRWTRGTVETLRTHKIMFFNPRYGVLGLLSYPYWFFFEFLAPIIEIIGFVAFLILSFLGMIQWSSFFILLGFIISFGFLYSVFAIMMDVLTYNQYKNKNDIYKLVLTALLEPFFFHPFVVWSALKGNIDYLRKRNSWGEMTRKGLNSQYTSEAAPIEIFNETIEPKPQPKLVQGTRELASYSLVFFVSMLFVKIYELIRDAQTFGIPKEFFKVIKFGIINEFSFDLNIAIFPAAIFLLLYLLNRKMARLIFVSLALLLLTVHAALAQYFLETLAPLGADALSYSTIDIRQTLGAAGVPIIFIAFIISLLALVITLFAVIPKKIKFSISAAFALLGIFILATITSISSITYKWKPGPEFSNSIALNKSYYFYSRCFQSLFPGTNGSKLSDEKIAPELNGFHYVDETHYPFLHTVDSSDVLSPFFNKQAKAPNLVFIVVEGLGRAFSNKDAYLGSFTPFLDSLSTKGLYWNNFLCEGGRTFAMLPSIYASLPFGKNSFLEMGDQMPAHASLLSILIQNGYSNNFFYGATGGSSWGYGDEEVFSKLNEVHQNEAGLSCNLVMTLSTHNPFLVNQQQQYLQLFEERMQLLQFDEAQKTEHRRYSNQYASILYADNAIRNLLNSYAQRADFSNTIFIITGDHRMPEIPMSTKIDRYHVPLIIYSPLLKRSQEFGALSTHFDITPSILSLLKHQYNLKVPSLATWMGAGLDTAHHFRNIHGYPLMQTKTDLLDYVMDEYFLHGDDLFKISNNMNLDPVENEEEKSKLKSAFTLFKQKNDKIANTQSMLPDSLLIY